MDYKDRIKYFKAELNLISNKSVKDFVKSCIDKAPDYVFEDCPSSSSGKFHPVDELAGDGTLVHTKRVFALAYEYSRALDCETQRDEICAAALLHDMVKQGREATGHTLKNHPELGAQLVAEVYNTEFKEKLNKDSANIIYWACFYHYGPWTARKYRKPLTEFTPSELCVYMADYTASKRFIHVDHKRQMGI